jgi:HEAT repeat protein
VRFVVGNSKTRTGLFSCFILALGQLTGAGAQNPPTTQELTRTLAELARQSWETRRDAFYRLLGFESARNWDGRTYLIPKERAALFRTHPNCEDDVKLALIRLLSTENAKVEARAEVVRKGGEPLSEDYFDYYGDVIGAVSGLDDPRALNALVGAMGTGGMDANGLARLGEPALDALITKSQSRDPETRWKAVLTMTDMWKPENRAKSSDEVSRQKLRAVFLKAARNEDQGLRGTGALGLGYMSRPDAEVIEVLLALAISDPALVPGESADDGGPYYSVRRLANLALARIGPPALDPLIAKFESPDAGARTAVVRSLATMWEPINRRTFSEDVCREKLKAVFLKAAADKEGSVRAASVHALRLVADADTIRVLKDLASSDPATAPGEGETGGAVYPVRRLARQALDQIEQFGGPR